jgi:hypothetical protein
MRQAATTSVKTVSTRTVSQVQPESNPDWKSQDPWMAIWVEELEKAYRDFARESGRLSRMAQRKKKVPIPSEAFSQLLAEKMEDVERALQLYLRRKEELLTYLKTTARRSEYTVRESAGSVVVLAPEVDSPGADATELAAS